MLKTLTLLAGLILAMTAPAGAKAADLENTLYIDLKDGRVTVEMFPDVAPKHVARIKELAREGFYDGVVFHRVIPGFMAQTGDPTGTGTGGSDKPDLKAEFSRDKSFERGTMGMARTANPNSANAQFFIMFAPAPHLNGEYTIWGKVVDGMQYVDNITPGEPPRNPDKMIKVQVAADAEK